MGGHLNPYHLTDDDSEKELAQGGASQRFKEFDCASCSAHNPVDPPFGDGEEVQCNYCGTEFRVKVGDEAKVKFKEI